MINKIASHAHKTIFDVLGQNSIEICSTCFKDLILQLMPTEIMHAFYKDL